MWQWLQDHRRKAILSVPFPAEWETVLGNIAYFQRCSEEERRQLRELVQVFVAEKTWEGCGGLTLTDSIRVTIAAEACLMILNLPHDLYSKVDSILVYPTTVVTPERSLGVFEVPHMPTRAGTPILGEAQLRGPVILVWDSVKQSARHPGSGHNVVYHEFAHKLDMLDGAVNGTPPLHGAEQYKEWAEICGREFSKLRADSESGKRTFIDSYGATNEAEFFAVITEEFFDQPISLQKHHKDLYEILQKFYQQDPALRINS
jgi:Mlc titration factor MtfA (ptsG expression regulator)